jgi:hypothetical protein
MSIGQKPSRVSIISGLLAFFLSLSACETSTTTGRLGLVTKDTVNSAILLKGGSTYQSLGPTSDHACFDAKDDVSPHDNFAEAVKSALIIRGADAILNVTIETHRGIYFPVLVPFILLPSGIAFPNRLCTTVSGTAIKFVEDPRCSPCLVKRQTKTLSESVVTVDSLQPVLKWEPWKWKPYEEPGQDVTYDLKVWILRKGRSDFREGTTVYEREGLTVTSHQVETVLEPSTHYIWAVRARYREEDQIQFTAWSDEGEGGEQYGLYDFHFLTPPPFAQGVGSAIKSE